MKTVLAASAAAAVLMAGTSLAAQEIDDRCLTAAVNAGVAQDYNVRYDEQQRACIATLIPGGTPVAGAGAGAVAVGLAGLGGGVGVAVGVGVLGVLAAAATGGGT